MTIRGVVTILVVFSVALVANQQALAQQQVTDIVGRFLNETPPETRPDWEAIMSPRLPERFAQVIEYENKGGYVYPRDFVLRRGPLSELVIDGSTTTTDGNAGKFGLADNAGGTARLTFRWRSQWW